MAATAVIYILWGASIGIAVRATIKALRTEHPLSSTKPARNNAVSQYA